jgi:hypothetical protein
MRRCVFMLASVEYSISNLSLNGKYIFENHGLAGFGVVKIPT